MSSSLLGDRVLVIIDADHRCRSEDCIELMLQAWPDAQVARHEPRSGLVDDPVLSGKHASATRFVAHWIVRVTAVRQGFGWTDAILMLVPETLATADLLERLTINGATVLRPSRTLH